MIKKKYQKYVFFSVLVLIILVLSGIIYTNINTINLFNKRINQLESDVQILVSDLRNKTQLIQQQTQTISDLEQDIEEKEQQIESLTLQIQSLSSQLGQTKAELEETTRLLNIAKNYEERVQQGIDLSQAYKLLGDYDKTVDIVKDITTIGIPTNDQEIWERTKYIYNWLGKNYQYCSDKGFCVGEYCTQIQFFSPDELLYYGSQDVLCGDCDDQAQLFAGMMYASGVPHSKVRVECGSVPGGGHCWNGVFVNNKWYRIDSVCSNPAEYWDFFGYKFLISGKEFPTNYQSVDCFSSYTASSWYNPEGYNRI